MSYTIFQGVVPVILGVLGVLAVILGVGIFVKGFRRLVYMAIGLAFVICGFALFVLSLVWAVANLAVHSNSTITFLQSAQIQNSAGGQFVLANYAQTDPCEDPDSIKYGSEDCINQRAEQPQGSIGDFFLTLIVVLLFVGSGMYAFLFLPLRDIPFAWLRKIRLRIEEEARSESKNL